MNPKALRYLLFAGLAIVWSTIIYKVINGLKGNDDKVQESFRTAKFDYSTPKDSFSLIADYPDPFMPGNDRADFENDTAYKIPAKEIDSKISQASKPEINIQFFGMISNPEKKKKVAIISISGKEYLVSEKEKIDHVLVGKIFREKITVVINGKPKQINRQNN
jgi:hypothetical protein